MINACRLKNKRVIVATQMLDSLEKNIQPTRAEVTDVFFAVDRGTDATMLSGETANGLYPTVAVNVMKQIDTQSEVIFDYDDAVNNYYNKTKLSQSEFGKLVKKLAQTVNPKNNGIKTTFSHNFIVHFTNNEREIFSLSSARLAAGVIVVTDDPKVYTGHGVDYGIFTHLVDDLKVAKKE